MSRPNNVIELVVKLKDQASAPLKELQAGIGHALKFGLELAGITAIGAVIEATFHKVLEATEEAEKSLASFELAYKNLGGAIGHTHDEMIKFSEDASKTTIFSHEDILDAEAVLLRFGSVTSTMFGRVRQDAIDLASVLHTDLPSAAQLLGKAIERPTIAIRQLRAAGVIFSADQERMIRQLDATGQRAKAAAIVLETLETRIKGAGDVAAGTLSGSLKELSHAWDDLFEGTPEQAKAMSDSIKELADTLNSPEVKQGFGLLKQDVVATEGFFAKLASNFAQSGADIANFIVPDDGTVGQQAMQGLIDELREAKVRLTELQASAERVDLTGLTKDGDGDSINAQIKSTEGYIATLTQSIKILNEELNKPPPHAVAGRSGGDRGSPSTPELQDVTDPELTPVVVTLKKNLDNLYKDWREKSLAQSDLDGEAFDKRIAELEQLRDANQITAGEFTRAWKEAVDQGLEPVIVTVKKRFTQPIQTEFEIALNNMVEDFTTAMGRMLDNGEFTWRTLGQYFLHEVEAGILKRAMAELQDLLTKALTPTATKGGGFWSSIIGAIFGGLTGGVTGGGSGGTSGPSTGGQPRRAGGGQIPAGGAWVGESGMEWVQRGTVYNASTMAGMAGGGVTLNVGGPTFNISGNNVDKEAMGAIKHYVDVGLARQSREMLRTLERNGLRRPV